MHRQLIPLMNMAFAETNPGPLKSVMDLVGVKAPRVLAPLVSPSPILITNLRAEVTNQLAALEQQGEGAKGPKILLNANE